MDNAETRVPDFNSGSIPGVEETLGEGEEMEVVASLLKQSREEKGISLKDAEKETHVPTHYLQILEGEGDPRLLADVLYLIPFLRTYSLFLGLDPALTIPQFIAGIQKGEVPSSVIAPPPRRLFSRATLVVLILVGLVALVLLWVVGEHSQ
jgi:cytoskeleton protein RodZ